MTVETNVCTFCQIIYDEDDIPYICRDRDQAATCDWNKPIKPALTIVGQEDPDADLKLDAMRQLIADGGAWIQGSWLALSAEAHIADGRCKPPRSKRGRECRAQWLAKR